MKTNIITGTLILTAFALGFTLNGYLIYKSILGNMTNAMSIPIEHIHER